MSTRIPSTSGIDPIIRRVLDPLKENIEIIKGQRGIKFAPLPENATNAEIIAKVNAVIARLQG